MSTDSSPFADPGGVRGEPLVALPKLIEPVTHVRSTLVATSLLAISDAGLGPAYWKLLPEGCHEAIASLIPGGWASIGLVHAHYAACQGLRLSQEELDELFQRTHERVTGTILGTVVALAKGVGATPWIAIKRYDGAWHRLFVGGGVGAWKVGPKEAHLEAKGLSILDLPYFARSVRMLHQRSLELFCSRVYVRPLPAESGALAYRVAWA